MFKNILAVCLIALFITSCKPSTEKKLIGKWQATKMESPQLELEIADTKAFIDTVGISTTPDQNFELYGVRNMDSLRDFMKSKMDITLREQKRMIDSTWIEFMNKGIVATNFGQPQPDTISWYLEDSDSTLILDEMKMRGSGSKIKMHIVKLDENALQLEFEENGFSSITTFTKAKN